jgi:hypothetical protein
MWALWVIAVLFLTAGSVGEGWAEDAIGARPLLTIAHKDLHTILPPDWRLVYGHGHHDPGHDERLFTLNRERDAKRAGNPALTQLITFVWFGELSRYDAEAGGFRVALGPNLTPTRWGVVRFKYENLPGDLLAMASATMRSELEQRLAQGESFYMTVAMTGRLIPDESIAYDFSHDQEGLGVIMPVVKVERLDYLLTNK